MHYHLVFVFDIDPPFLFFPSLFLVLHALPRKPNEYSANEPRFLTLFFLVAIPPISVNARPLDSVSNIVEWTNDCRTVGVGVKVELNGVVVSFIFLLNREYKIVSLLFSSATSRFIPRVLCFD